MSRFRLVREEIGRQPAPTRLLAWNGVLYGSDYALRLRK